MSGFSIKMSNSMVGVQGILGKVSQGAYSLDTFKKVRARMLPNLATFVLIALLAYQLAGLTWDLYKDESDEKVDKSPSTFSMQADSKDVKRASYPGNLERLHLFGVPAKKVIKREPVKILPKVVLNTSLNLTLFGVFADINPRIASAIIGKSSSNQRYYLVGDIVSKGVKLEEVRDDHVILLRNGRYETLRFPISKGVQGRTSFKSGKKQSGRIKNKKTADLVAFRQIIKNQPMKIMEYVRFIPVKEQGGKSLKGFRVSPKKDHVLFKQLGLKTSDIIVAVNGISLKGTPKVAELLQDLKNADQIVLEVIRRGKPHSITLDL